MKTVHSPILGVLWNGRHRMVLALPFGLDAGETIYLQLGPDCYAEFTFDEFTAAAFFDAAPVLPQRSFRSATFNRVVDAESCKSRPCLCPTNVPMMRDLVETTYLSRFSSDCLKDLAKKVLARISYHELQQFVDSTLHSRQPKEGRQE